MVGNEGEEGLVSGRKRWERRVGASWTFSINLKQHVCLEVSEESQQPTHKQSLLRFTARTKA